MAAMDSIRDLFVENMSDCFDFRFVDLRFELIYNVLFVLVSQCHELGVTAACHEDVVLVDEFG